MADTDLSHLSDKHKELIDWQKKVLQKDDHQCINCARKTNIAVSFVVPPEVGGQMIASNGVTLCRYCKRAADNARTLPHKIDNKTPINFLISRKLHNRVDDFVKNSNFGSLSALIRYMIAEFISNPDSFDDLAIYQDEGSDVKINSWIDGDKYKQFKAICQIRNISYTDAFKGLLQVAMDQENSLSKVLS